MKICARSKATSSLSQTGDFFRMHNEGDVEKESLRKEVKQLRNALRLTTEKLAETDDAFALELEQERALRRKLEERCQFMSHEIEECRMENSELVNELLDVTNQADELRNKLRHQEEIIRKLGKSIIDVQKERDEMADELIASNKEDDDLHKIEMTLIKKLAQKQLLAVKSDKEELQERLICVTHERDELERRFSYLGNRLDQQANSDVKSTRNAAEYEGQSTLEITGQQRSFRKLLGNYPNSNDENSRIRRRFSIAESTISQVLYDAASLIPAFGEELTFKIQEVADRRSLLVKSDRSIRSSRILDLPTKDPQWDALPSTSDDTNVAQNRKPGNSVQYSGGRPSWASTDSIRDISCKAYEALTKKCDSSSVITSPLTDDHTACASSNIVSATSRPSLVGAALDLAPNRRWSMLTSGILMTKIPKERRGSDSQQSKTRRRYSIEEYPSLLQLGS